MPENFNIIKWITMKNYEIILISIALAMDAFSVSICKGLTMKHKFKRNSLIMALSFSLFQMIMPLIGYFLGSKLSGVLITFNHIIAFVLLFIIGFNMLHDAYHDEEVKEGLSISELIFLSFATSIDAMAVGITFSFFEINLKLAIFLIGLMAFLFSLIGVYLGKLIGHKFEKKAQVIGGVILIIIGFKILLQHFF